MLAGNLSSHPSFEWPTLRVRGYECFYARGWGWWLLKSRVIDRVNEQAAVRSRHPLCEVEELIVHRVN